MNKAQQLTIVLGCKGKFKATDYEKMRKSIEYQIRAGSVILLPAYMHVEAVIQQDGSRHIEIKQEREDKAHELQEVEKAL
jgi:hypothetical protein